MFVATEEVPAEDELNHDDHQPIQTTEEPVNISNCANNKGEIEDAEVFRKQSTGNDSAHSMHTNPSIRSHTSSHHSQHSSQHSSNINERTNHSSTGQQQSFRRPRTHDRRHRKNPPRLQTNLNMNQQQQQHNRQGIQNRNSAHSPITAGRQAVRDSHHFLEQIGHAQTLSRYGSQMGSGAELDPDSNVYVANLPCNYGEEKLRKLFFSFGQIIRLKFVTPDESSQPGYGFVQFQNKNDAHRAMQELEGYRFESGESIYLSIALRRRSSLSDEPTNLYVKQLPPNWDQNMLHRVFGRYGMIRQSKVVGDGIAFVRYDAHEQALNAISNLDKSDQGNGYFLEVKFATRKTAANAYRLQQIPAQNQQNSNNLYVRNLPKVNFGQTCLENLFITYGKISSAKSNDNGSAFVRFANANDAQKAINALHGTKPDQRFEEELMVKLAHYDIGDSRNRWKNDNNYQSNVGGGTGGSGSGGGHHSSSYKAFNNNMYSKHFNAPSMAANFNNYQQNGSGYQQNGNGYPNNDMNMQSNAPQQTNTNQLLAHMNLGQNIFNMNAMKGMNSNSMNNSANDIPQLQQQMSQWQIAGENNINQYGNNSNMHSVQQQFSNPMLMNNTMQQQQQQQLIPGQPTQASQHPQNLFMFQLGNAIQMPVMYNAIPNNMTMQQQSQLYQNQMINNAQNKTVVYTEKQQQLGNVLVQKISSQSQYSNWAMKITGMILRLGDKAAQMCIDNENELKKQIENAVTILKEENTFNRSVGVINPPLIISTNGLNNTGSAVKNRIPISPLTVNAQTLNNLQNLQNSLPQSSGTPVDLSTNSFFNVFPALRNSLPNSNRVMTGNNSGSGNVAGMQTMVNGNLVNNMSAAAMANINLLNHSLCISPLGTPKGGISVVSNNPLLLPVLRGTSPIIDIRSLNSSPMAPTNSAISSGWAMAANVGQNINLINNRFNTGALNNSLNALTNINMNLNTISNLNSMTVASNGSHNQLGTGSGSMIGGNQNIMVGNVGSIGVNNVNNLNAVAKANQMKQILMQQNMQ